MNKNNILNIVLFIVVVALASVIYFSEEESTELKKLTETRLNDINSISIEHKNRVTKIAKSADNHWNIIQPVAIAANDFRINSVLKLLNAPVHARYSVADIDLATYNLDEPEMTVQFNNRSIAFGLINPATKLRYVRLDNFVYTIEDVYYPLITSHYSTLISLNLLPLDSKIIKLVLPDQTLSRNENGLWTSNKDISADNINKTIDHWLNDQAFGVHAYLVREPLGEVFVYLQDQQKPVNFHITDTDPWLILSRPEIGLEYHLDIEAYDNLIVPQ